MISYLTPGYPRSLFKTVAEVLGAELVVAEEGSGPGADDDPLTDGRADLAWLCSTAFVELDRRPGSAVRHTGIAWTPADPAAGARPAYHADVVVRPDSAVAHFAELAGRRIACNDHQSLSGYHALRFEIASSFDDPDDFAELVMTGGHRRSVEMLLAGEVDAATVDGILLAAWRRDDPATRGLATVRRLGPWPTQPLIAARRVGDGEIERIRRRLVAANADELVRHELARAGLGAFVAVGDDHCAAVERAMFGA